MCAGKQTGVYWEADWLLYAGEHIDVCREANWCVLGRRLVCIRKHIDVCREANWCILGSRLVAVRWEAY
jgi:hypothetical protein